jgi:hypothetical protein
VDECKSLPPGLLGLLGPVLQLAVIELRAGELADGGVHAVLRLQQVYRIPALLEALEQALVILVVRGNGRQHRDVEAQPEFESET